MATAILPQSPGAKAQQNVRQTSFVPQLSARTKTNPELKWGEKSATERRKRAIAGTQYFEEPPIPTHSQFVAITTDGPGQSSWGPEWGTFFGWSWKMLKLQPKGRQIEWFPCRGTIDKTAVWGLYCMYAIVGLMYLWRKYRRVFQNIVNCKCIWHALAYVILLCNTCSYILRFWWNMLNDVECKRRGQMW